MIEFDEFLRIDDLLAWKGHHPLTPFWRETLQRLYCHPTATTLVARVGRGGAKSFTSTKVGLIETLLGDWRIPPGERHFWAYVSVSKEEAAQRLRLLEAFLDALKIKYDSAGNEIALRDMPRGFRVFACNVGAVSGFRCYGYSADELAKWIAGHDYANPASEVCASLNAMCVTHPGARKILISSPLASLDYHSERFERGDTEDQIVAHAPTWIANPQGTSEASTRAAEPDDRVWSREYAAIPANAVNAALERNDVEACFRPVPLGYLVPQRWYGIEDPSSLRGDAYTWCRVGVLMPDPRRCEIKLNAGDKRKVRQVDADGKFIGLSEEIVTSPMSLRDENGSVLYHPIPNTPLLRIDAIGAVEGKQIGAVRMDDVVRRVAASLGATHVFSDQREAASLEALHRRHGMQFESIAWTNEKKTSALLTLRRLMKEGAISIEPHPTMRDQLLGLEERLLPSGAWTYGARRGAHDDFAALLLTACMAINEARIAGAESWASHARTEWTAKSTWGNP